MNVESTNVTKRSNDLDKLPAQAKKSEVAVQPPSPSDPRLASSNLLGDVAVTSKRRYI